MSKNYLCIHGHFYQPPRENPWLEAIEYQPSAFPYHDWNERVARECYSPNTRARLQEEGRIVGLVNNYEYMNFDFGPTLLSWLEKARPWTYQQIVAADRASRERYHGHGSGMAQVYNHIIMPLATTRDKRTQIRWGLADFEHRFGRPAEGMWLAETAADLETLALMAEEGVRFTVLAPTQAKAVRTLDAPRERWKNVSGGGIDTTQAYRVFPRGKGSPSLDVFFFDRELSKAVAYEKVLASGSDFLARLKQGAAAGETRARLINVATDGESYGHHFKFGDMALAWLFDHLEKDENLELSNYAWFLDQFPPGAEVRIVENSSWSCAHGVERWRSDCGCSVGQREGWNQAWRTPLREAMDWLSGELSAIFEEQGGKMFRDPWAARDDYVVVLLDSSPENRDRFLATHLREGAVDEGKKVTALELMESQRMALYMYTSCGWFFDDISGLEATQVLRYADRAMELTRKWSRLDMESAFLSIIARAKSNDPDFGDGAGVFEKRAKPVRMSPGRIAANHVFTQMMQEGHGPESFFDERVQTVGNEPPSDPQPEKTTGELLVSDPMTGKITGISFSAAGRGPHDFECQAHEEEGQSTGSYGFADMVPDTLRGVMNGIVGTILSSSFPGIRDEKICSLLSLRNPPEEIKEPLPDGLGDILRLFLSKRLLGLADEPESLSREMAALRKIVRKVDEWEYPLRLEGPELRAKGRILANGLMHQVTMSPRESIMRVLMEFLDLADAVSLKIDLWACQNYYWDVSRAGDFLERLSPDEEKTFKALGSRLGFFLEGGI
jgi:alpha-amylase/alpha-mannosidase (GH57 family)